MILKDATEVGTKRSKGPFLRQWYERLSGLTGEIEADMSLVFIKLPIIKTNRS